MQVLEYKIKNVVVLELRDRVDEVNSRLLSEELKTIVLAGRFFIAIDLSKASFLSAKCLNVIWKQKIYAEKYKGNIVLCGASEKVLDTINQVGFDRVLSRFFTLDEGLDFLEKQHNQILTANSESRDKNTTQLANTDPPKPKTLQQQIRNCVRQPIRLAKALFKALTNTAAAFVCACGSQSLFINELAKAETKTEDAYSRAYTLDEILGLAKDISPQIKLSRLKMEERASDVTGAKSYLFPRIVGTTGYLYQNNPSTFNEIINRELTNGYSKTDDTLDSLKTRTKAQIQNNLAVVGLGFSQLVYSGGFFSGIVKLKESQIVEADAQISIESMNIEDQVRTLYMTVLLLNEKLRLLKSKQESINNRLLAIRKARSAKIVGENQVTEIEIADLKNTQDQLTVQQEESSARGLLNIMIGHPTEAPLNLKRLDKFEEINLGSIEEYFDIAIHKYPEIRKSQALMDSASAQSQIVTAQTAWSPQIVVFGTSEYVQGLGSKANDGYSWSIGTALVMTLYDGPKSAAETEKAISQASQAKILYEVSERKLKIEIAEIVSKIKLALLEKKLAEKTLNIAIERKEQVHQAVKNGQLPEFRLGEAVTAEIEASIAIISSEAQLLRWQSKLRMLLGGKIS